MSFIFDKYTQIRSKEEKIKMERKSFISVIVNNKGIQKVLFWCVLRNVDGL